MTKSSALSLFVSLLVFGCNGGYGPPETETRAGAIADGTNDLRLNAAGRFINDLSQWRRDAAVAIVPDGCDTAGSPVRRSNCSGVLVAPRIVLTNAHCVSSIPGGVSFSPANPGIGGTVPPGTPNPVCVPVVACAAHSRAVQMCGDGLPPTTAYADRDLAVLLLAERMDHGESGTRTQRYAVVPATIVPHDDEIFGEQTPDSWNLRRVQHVGYGPIDGCIPGGGTIPPLRQMARQSIEFGNWVILEQSSSMALFGVHGLPGDSGGPVFLEESGPLRVLGIHRGVMSLDVFPTCAPELSLVRDHAVRLTHSSIQEFLAPFFNAFVSPSTTGVVWVAGQPTAPLWTGDLDLPPATEPVLRGLVPLADAADPDGDGLVGARDNCWGISNIDQDASAPTNLTGTCVDASAGWIMRSYGCLPASGTVEADIDRDRDGIPDACDNCDDVYNPPQADCDDDGIGDACETHSDADQIPDDCDNCDTDFNPGQGDCDRDGIGDACETDRDDDGVPDDCDNCSADPNYTQLNCNHDAEVQAGVPVRGDACDPTPCARAVVEAEVHDDGDRLTVVTMVKSDPAGTDAGPFRTGFRFCPCSVATDNEKQTRDACRVIQTDGSGGCTIGDADDYAAEEVENWRIPTLESLSLDGGEVTMSHDVPMAFAHAAQWPLSDIDRPRWQRLFPTSYAGTTGMFRGVFWSHTRATGAGDPLPSETRRLSSHYWSGAVGIDFVVDVPPRREPYLPMVPFPFPFDEGFCPFCASGAAVPWVVLPCLDADCGAVDAPVLMAGPAPLRPGKMQGIEIPGFELLVPGTRWVAAAEPAERLGKDTLRFAALSEDGTRVTDVIWFDGTGLQKLEAGCAPGKCGQVPDPFRAANVSGHASVTAATRSPVARTGFATAFSASEGLAFVAGGRDAQGLPLKDLWAYDIRRQSWMPVSTFGLQVGKVLAVAWNPIDSALYVLDEVTAGGLRMARLLHVTPGSKPVVDGRWPRLGLTNSFGLAVGSEGQLWLTASRTGVPAHVVASLSRERGLAWRVNGVALGKGWTEPGGLYAHSGGVSLVSRRSGKSDIVGYATAQLRTDIALERCF